MGNVLGPSASIWNVEERRVRFGINISEQSLRILAVKRQRQYKRLVQKYTTLKMPAVVRIIQARAISSAKLAS